jgi:hypothetical protein
MWNVDSVVVEHLALDDDYVDIDLAFAPTLTLRATKHLLDCLAAIVDLACSQITGANHRTIDELRLIDIAHWFSPP